MRSASDFAPDVRTGMLQGAALGCACAVLAVVAKTVVTSPLVGATAAPLGRLTLGYIAGGAVAGAVVGLLRPLRRWLAGALVVGVVAAVPLMYGFALAAFGPVSAWDATTRTAVPVAAVVYGLLAGGRSLGPAPKRLPWVRGPRRARSRRIPPSGERTPPR